MRSGFVGFGWRKVRCSIGSVAMLAICWGYVWYINPYVPDYISFFLPLHLPLLLVIVAVAIGNKDTGMNHLCSLVYHSCASL
jgi:hypothetical protein